MKILFIYSPHHRLSLINAIQAEIIIGHLKREDEVTLLTCSGELPACYLNPEHKKDICYRCRLGQKRMLDVIGTHKSFKTINYDKGLREQPGIRFNTISDLKAYEYDGTNVGTGVASMLISRVRDHELDPVDHQAAIARDLAASVMILKNFRAQMKTWQPDLVYTFNGRFAYQFPIVTESRRKGIYFRTFEFTTKRDKYHIVERSIPHDIAYEESEIKKKWVTGDESLAEKMEIGASFYENTRGGVGFMEKSFVTYQQKNLLPKAVHSGKKVISIFNSSIDEFASVPGWERPLFFGESEYDIISGICERFKDDDDKVFILRVHPNLKYLDNAQTRDINRLRKYSNLVIIDAESKVDTYGLIDASDKVITFGSTVGIEATYWNRPSILLGLCFYMNLGGTYNPHSMEELCSMLEAQLPPKDKTAALQYGNWWLSFGEKFEYYGNGGFSHEALSLSAFERRKVMLLKLLNTDVGYVMKRLFSRKFYRKIFDKDFRGRLRMEMKMFND